MKIHIYAPAPSAMRIHKSFCPTCEKKQFFFSTFVDWYGWHDTCLWCGEQWEDGEMLARPFMPRWRKQNVEYAKKLYRKLRGTVGKDPPMPTDM